MSRRQSHAGLRSGDVRYVGTGLGQIGQSRAVSLVAAELDRMEILAVGISLMATPTKPYLPISRHIRMLASI